MEEAVGRQPAARDRSGRKGKASKSERSGVVPPILVLKDDDTRLHVFDTVERLVAHQADHSFGSSVWDLYDVRGTELKTIGPRSTVAGLETSDTKEAPGKLKQRVKSVLNAVEARLDQEDNLPDPESGIDVSSIDGLENLTFGMMMDKLVELFWTPPEEIGRPAPIRRAGPAISGTAGSGRQGTRPKTGADSVTVVTGDPDPEPNTRGWWHNMWGH